MPHGVAVRLLLAVTVLLLERNGVAAGRDCYQFGSAGWDLFYWGDPRVRLPTNDGSIPICATPFGGVIFRWRTRQGVFVIPSENCPGSFDPPYNSSFRQLAPVKDSNVDGFPWFPMTEEGAQPGTYWVTSQAPGACEAGVKVRVDVVDPAGSGAWAMRGRGHWPLASVILATAACVFFA